MTPTRFISDQENRELADLLEECAGEGCDSCRVFIRCRHFWDNYACQYSTTMSKEKMLNKLNKIMGAK